MIHVSRVHVYLTYPFVLSWSLLESMSAGAAIVAGSTDPVTEVMDDGKTGLLVNFFDPDEIVDRVNEFMHDTALRQALGQAARREVIENYDLRSICLPRLLDWVDSVAQFSFAPVVGSLR
jgi:glycosyltransferase involved in cell wall biosynthesis